MCVCVCVTDRQAGVCVCFTGIGHINVLGPNPLTLPAVQSEENLRALLVGAQFQAAQ